MNRKDLISRVENEMNIKELNEEEKSVFAKMIDRMCQLHPENENYHDTKVRFCEEFLETIKSLQGKDLEPYLAGIKAVRHEGCFKIEFKIPLVSYNELRSL